jgi:hypothetical protein
MAQVTEIGLTLNYLDVNCSSPYYAYIWSDCQNTVSSNDFNNCTLNSGTPDYFTKSVCVNATSFGDALQPLQGSIDVSDSLTCSLLPNLSIPIKIVLFQLLRLQSFLDLEFVVKKAIIHLLSQPYSIILFFKIFIV